MKRLLACLTAGVFLLSGCQKTHEPTGATLEVSLEHSFAAEMLFPGHTFGYDPLLCGEWLVDYAYEEESCIVTALNRNTGEEKALSSDKSHPIGAETDGDGYRLFFAETDYTAETLATTYTFAAYDSSFVLVSEEDMTAEFTCMEENAVPSFLCRTPDGGYLLRTDRAYYFDEDFTLQGKLSEAVDRAFTGQDGALYGVSSSSVYRIDTESLTCEVCEVPEVQQPMLITPGLGEYTFFCSDNERLYGVDVKAQTAEEVMNFTNSDLRFDDIFKILPQEDGTFLLLLRDADNTASLCRFRERTEEEIAGLHLISLAVYQNSDKYLQELVNRFNRQATDCRIVITSCLPYDNNTEQEMQAGDAAFSELQKQMLSGVVPDMLCVSHADYEALSLKGLFEDWYPWMQDDPDFNESDYFMNVFDAMAFRGRAERISSFC